MNKDEIENLITKNLSGSYFLIQQCDEAQKFALRALGELSKSQKDFTAINAFVYSSVISYSRCFTSSGKGKSTLDHKNVYTNSVELLEKHKEVIEYRNNVVAHVDSHPSIIPNLKMHHLENETIVSLGVKLNISDKIPKLVIELCKELGKYVGPLPSKKLKKISAKVNRIIRLKNSND